MPGLSPKVCAYEYDCSLFLCFEFCHPVECATLRTYLQLILLQIHLSKLLEHSWGTVAARLGRSACNVKSTVQAFVWARVRTLVKSQLQSTICSVGIYIQQWCTTSGPRATSGPRRGPLVAPT